MLHENGFVELPANTRGRDLFFGDLHGNPDLLEQLLVAAHFDPAADRLFSVGDLVDHGPDNTTALQWLTEWPYFHAVLGNHDALARDSLDGDWYAMDVHRKNGGRWLRGAIWDPATLDLIEQALHGMPLGLEIALADGRRLGLIHAEVPRRRHWSCIRKASTESIDSADDFCDTVGACAIWARYFALGALAVVKAPERSRDDAFRQSIWPRRLPTRGIDLLVCGHTVTPKGRPLRAANRWMIDTGPNHEQGALVLVDVMGQRYWRVPGEKNPEPRQVTVHPMPAALDFGLFKPRRKRSRPARLSQPLSNGEGAN